jgi:4-hydroxybenzoate polyprenyltransferase
LGIATESHPARLLSYLHLLRPRQMIKNLFCLGGVLFSGRFEQPKYIMAAFGAVAAFCLGSSAVYIFNDLLDRGRDRLHPKKRRRPLASGAVGVAEAVSIALLLTLAAFAFAIAARLPMGVAICLACYLVMNLAYSHSLKHFALVDVICIALGFVLRLLAGIYAIEDLPTSWITLCTFFLCLFLGFCKRRSELAGLDAAISEQAQRPVLAKYTVQFLDYLVNSSAVMAIMCYALFTTTASKNPTLVVTVPLVFFAVMHYKRLVMMWEFGEPPELVVVRDVRLLASALLWLVCYFAITLGNIHLFR